MLFKNIFWGKLEFTNSTRKIINRVGIVYAHVFNQILSPFSLKLTFFTLVFKIFMREPNVSCNVTFSNAFIGTFWATIIFFISFVIFLSIELLLIWHKIDVCNWLLRQMKHSRIYQLKEWDNKLAQNNTIEIRFSIR